MGRAGRAKKLEGFGQLGLGFSIEEMTKVPATDWVAPDLSSLPDKLFGVVGVDTETDDEGLRSGQGAGWAWRGGVRVVGYSISADNWSGYLPVGHPDGNVEDPDRARRWLNHVLGDAAQLKVFANQLYDVPTSEVDGVVMRGPMIDVQIIEALIDEHRLQYNLDSIARDRIGDQKNEELLREAARVYGFGNTQKETKSNLHRLPAKFVGPYATWDAEAPRRIWRVQQPLVESEGLGRVVRLEHELIPLYVDMRRRGVRIDVDYIEQFRNTLVADISKETAEIKRRCGREVNIWAPKSVAAALKEVGITCPTTEKTNQPSVTHDFLERCGHWLTKAVLRARERDKLVGTFIDGQILGALHDGRVHGSIHPLKSDDGGTTTGRLAMSAPNLQFIPVRTKEGKKIRRAFIPEHGEQWASADYCFDDQTEVLTRRGFVKFSSVSRSDLFAQFSTIDDSITFARPIQLVRRTLNGEELIQIGGRDGDAVDISVTAKHRCLMLHLYGGTYHYATASNYPNNTFPDYAMINAGRYEPPAPVSSTVDEIRLSCAIQANYDGVDRGGELRLTPPAPAEPGRIDSLNDAMRAVGVVASKVDYLGSRSWKITRSDLPTGVSRLLDRGSFSRNILELPISLRETMLDYATSWTGSYQTSDRISADLIQEMATLSGHASSLIETREGLHRVVLTNQRLTRMQDVASRRVMYDGRVYCATMPEGTLVVRRNGRVVVTGNSQQEPRLLVHYAHLTRRVDGSRLTGAAEARDRYRDDPDMSYHQFVADLTELEYKAAKILNLAIIYGRGVDETASQLGKTRDETKELFARHAERMPFARQMSQACQDRVRERGYIVSLSGRRMRFPFWEPRDWDERDGRMLRLAAAEAEWGVDIVRARIHKSLNSLIQPSAADQMKYGMLAVHKAGLGQKVLIQVHDELCCSVTGRAEADMIATIMRDAVQLEVPSKVDVDLGSSWMEQAIESP